MKQEEVFKLTEELVVQTTVRNELEKSWKMITEILNIPKQEDGKILTMQERATKVVVEVLNMKKGMCELIVENIDLENKIEEKSIATTNETT